MAIPSGFTNPLIPGGSLGLQNSVRGFGDLAQTIANKFPKADGKKAVGVGENNAMATDGPGTVVEGMSTNPPAAGGAVNVPNT